MNQKILIGVLVVVLLAGVTLVVVHHHKASATSEDLAQTSVPLTSFCRKLLLMRPKGTSLRPKKPMLRLSATIRIMKK